MRETGDERERGREMGQRDEQERGREMSESEAERCLGRRVMPWSVCDALVGV